MIQTVTFHNKAKIKVQAQIFTGHTLISTCLAGPGETQTLPAASIPYDIFFKNGSTGWEVARELNSKAKTLTLSQGEGCYTVT
jgi:hypothetical protein